MHYWTGECIRSGLEKEVKNMTRRLLTIHVSTLNLAALKMTYGFKNFCHKSHKNLVFLERTCEVNTVGKNDSFIFPCHIKIVSSYIFKLA